MLGYLYETATWVLLSRLRNSFLSKAVSALSLSSLALANLPGFVLEQGDTPSSLRVVLAGALLFLVGYVAFFFLAPPDLREAGEIHDHVGRMAQIADREFIASRIRLAGPFLERSKGGLPRSVPFARWERLRQQVEHLRNVDPATLGAEARAAFFYADLSARQHDWPDRRIAVAVALVVGAALMALPTAANVLAVILGR